MTLIETLNNLDKELFLFLNGFNSQAFDYIMTIISAKLTWIPLYLGVAFFLFKKFKFKKGITAFLSLIFLLVLTDQISVIMFKNVFMRLRPCFDSDIAHLVHYVDLPGGKSG